MNSKTSNVVGLATAANKNAIANGSSKSRTRVALDALNTITTNFATIVNKDTRETWVDNGVITPQRIAYGAYNEIIFRAENGAVTYGCTKDIDAMRSERKYTFNAVELRCDALGLAIYVGGVTQIGSDNLSVKKGIRLAAYQHKSLKAEITICASAEDVYRQLHTILVCTYNRLGREYNIAGLTQEDLTLVSDSKRMPNICITAPL